MVRNGNSIRNLASSELALFQYCYGCHWDGRTLCVIRNGDGDNYGPGCGQEPGGGYLSATTGDTFPRISNQIKTMADYKRWIDGYDTGIWYADKHIGDLLEKLESLGVLDDTLIMLSSDHGENQGELAVYGDHQTGDHITNRVPMILRHPKGLGGKGSINEGICYTVNLADSRPDLVDNGLAIIEEWTADELRRSKFPDPLWEVLGEGGPFHANFKSPRYGEYLKRLRDTGRGHFAEELEARAEAQKGRMG